MALSLPDSLAKVSREPPWWEASCHRIPRASAGGGQGIGRAFAHALGEAGAAVAVVDVVRETAEATAQELAAKGIRSLAVVADITRAKDCERCAHALALPECWKWWALLRASLQTSRAPRIVSGVRSSLGQLASNRWALSRTLQPGGRGGHHARRGLRAVRAQVRVCLPFVEGMCSLATVADIMRTKGCERCAQQLWVSLLESWWALSGALQPWRTLRAPRTTSSGHTASNWWAVSRAFQPGGCGTPHVSRTDRDARSATGWVGTVVPGYGVL